MSIFHQLRSYMAGSIERAVTPALDIDLAPPQHKWHEDRCLFLPWQDHSLAGAHPCYYGRANIYAILCLTCA